MNKWEINRSYKPGSCRTILYTVERSLSPFQVATRIRQTQWRFTLQKNELDMDTVHVHTLNGFTQALRVNVVLRGQSLMSANNLNTKRLMQRMCPDNVTQIYRGSSRTSFPTTVAENYRSHQNDFNIGNYQNDQCFFFFVEISRDLFTGGFLNTSMIL